MSAQPEPPDIISVNYGTVIEFRGETRRGHSFIRKLRARDWQRRDGWVACEHRAGIEILQAAIAQGLLIRDGSSGRLSRRADAP